MGKLQYINRKIDGVKLGGVVAKDLTKRTPPGLGSKAALRDPQIELDVSSKAINDEAAALVFDALAKAIAHPAGTTILEELRLRDNLLTVSCLQGLAKVIDAASCTLQELDLGENSLSVESQEDLCMWEEFLRAFRECRVMRKLDLSRNRLGPKALALLARVYLQEEQEWERQVSAEKGLATTETLGAELRTLSVNSAIVEEVAEALPAEKRSRSHSKPSPSLMALYASSNGLRSIPYIILDSCGLTDECALHLSYVIERHDLVAELINKVPPARAGDPVRQLEAYDALDGCDGIIWVNNESLSEAGRKVLQLAEQARMRDNGDVLDNGRDNETAIVDSPMIISRKLTEASSPFTPLSSRKRRNSVSTSHSTPHSAGVRSFKTDPLRTARSRIQGDVLRDHGPARNELWLAALRMLAAARPLLLQPMLTDVSEEQDEEGKAEGEGEDSHRTPMGARRPATPELDSRDSPRIHQAELTTSPEEDDAAWPRLPLVEAGTKSRKYAVLKLAKGRDGQHTLRPELQTPVKVHLPDLDTDVQFKTTLTPPQLASPPRLPSVPYRSHLAKGLSKEVWGKVLACVVDSEGLLTDEQQAQVIEYANSRASLRREREVLGKPSNVQIWRVLEGMGCLNYE